MITLQKNKMPDYIVYGLFALGFVFLIKGADILVKGASAIAKKYNISDMVIGLTIVSFGTSMPELIVSLFSAIEGNTEIAIGNVVGSNIANILLVLGVSAIIFPLTISKTTVLTEVPFSLIAALSIGFFANVTLFGDPTGLQLSRYEGMLLLAFLILFMLYIVKLSPPQEAEEITVEKSLTIPKSILYIVIGVSALFLGGKWVVDGAVKLAEAFGMSQSLIGLTVVAVGTSLPELATSAMAAYRKNSDIAVGNVVGSNIFNILWILGLTATIKPIPFQETSNFDIFMIVIASLMLILSIGIGKRNSVDRGNGVVFLLVYAAYVTFLIYKG